MVLMLEFLDFVSKLDGVMKTYDRHTKIQDKFWLSAVIIKGYKIFKNFSVINSSVARFCLAGGSNIVNNASLY